MLDTTQNWKWRNFWGMGGVHREIGLNIGVNILYTTSSAFVHMYLWMVFDEV
jgi:hypothetical protein